MTTAQKSIVPFAVLSILLHAGFGVCAIYFADHSPKIKKEVIAMDLTEAAPKAPQVAAKQELNDEVEKAIVVPKAPTPAPVKPAQLKPTPVVVTKPVEKVAPKKIAEKMDFDKDEPAKEVVPVAEEVADEAVADLGETEQIPDKAPVMEPVKETQPAVAPVIVPPQKNQTEADLGKETATPIATKTNGAANSNGATAGSPNQGQVRSVDQLKQVPGNPKPQYNETERIQRQEGDVVYMAYVSKDGTPTQFQQKKSSGHNNLDQKTLDSLKKWKFYPGQEGWVEIPFKWNIRGNEQERSALGATRTRRSGNLTPSSN